jgi:amino acid transporter
MGRDREMPAILGLLHGRYATPHAGVWILAAVSAALGVFGVQSLDNLIQITLASNTGTFLVYGMTCLIALVAFTSHHERGVFKHVVIPGAGLLMNVAELCGVVYLAITAGGAASRDAVIALAIVGAWIVAGVAWVGINSARQRRPMFAEVDKVERKPVMVG